LAVSIFSIMATSLYVTFAHGIKLNRESQSLEDVYRDARWTIEALTFDLENAVAFEYSQEGGQIYQTIVKDATDENVAVETGFISDEEPVVGSDSFVGKKDSLFLIVRFQDGLKGILYSLKEGSQIELFQEVVGMESAPRAEGIIEYEEKKETLYLIREVFPLASLDTEKGKSSEETQILSSLVCPDGLKFFYARRDETREEKPVLWEEEWREAFQPLGVRIQLSLVNMYDRNDPIRIEKDIFLPTSSLSSLEFFSKE